MTVETTIQQMFDRYPMMYSTRKECLDHLLCTIGNGYEWKWGQLVYRDRGDLDYNEAYEKEINEADYDVEHPQAKQSRENLDERKRHDEIWIRHGLIKPEEKYDWYPLSRRYSKLFTIPEDARPDWKAAVEECKRMLEEDGVDWQNAK